MSSNSTLGLDIGGTKVLGVVLDADGTVVKELRVPSPVEAFESLVEACAEIVADLGADGAPVGVGAAGLVDTDGYLRYAPNLPGLRDAPLRDAIAAATGRRVVVDNDANAAAVGELEYGGARGARHALLVTLGTGIGGGIVLDGKLYRGAHGFAAEVGHMRVADNALVCACGAVGHWETIASGTALGRMARDDPEFEGETGEDVGVAAAAGDPAALRLLGRYADNVALGLVNLTNLFDPECFVVAGGLVELGPLLFEPLHDAFRARLQGSEYWPDIPILPAELGEHAGAVGAAVLARSLLDTAA